MAIIIAALMTLGLITAPEQATDQLIKDNEKEIQAVIGEDTDVF